MKNEDIIASINVGDRSGTGQPKIGFKLGYNKRPALFVCDNGYQSTVTDISTEMFDALKVLVNAPAVVEYYESIRHE